MSGFCPVIKLLRRLDYNSVYILPVPTYLLRLNLTMNSICLHILYNLIKRLGILLFIVFIAGLSACGNKSAFSSQDFEKTSASGPQSIEQNDARHIANTCVSCHPANGKIVDPTYPQINGQTANYLSSSLQDYVSGARKDAAMQKAVANLKQQDIADMANYYAALDTPWKTVLLPEGNSNTAPSQEDINAGAALAVSCNSCHGDKGNSEQAGISSLAGLSISYFTKALNEYFTDQRDNEFMKVFKTAFTPEKIARLAAYYSQQTRVKTKLPVKGDTKNGQQIARQKCNGCHGDGGNSAMDEFPTIAGQNQAFLRQALSDYKNGHRLNSLMQNAVKNLSNDDINNLAAYFAQQTPKPKPSPSQYNPDDPASAGQAASQSCWGCHGALGNSVIDGIPNLSGMSPNYIKEAIIAYRNGTRHHELMKTFVVSLTDEQIDLISHYFAAQKPVATKFPGKGNAKATRPLIPGCASCHGYRGVSTTNVPSIAGQNANYIRQAIQSYKSGDRTSSEMKNATAKLSNQDIINLATFYAKQSPSTPTFTPLVSAKQWIQKCFRCHVAQQPGVPATGPRIVGQSEAYLRKALHEYQKGSRKHSIMFAMTDVLSDWEINRLARYLASLPADGK